MTHRIYAPGKKAEKKKKMWCQHDFFKQKKNERSRIYKLIIYIYIYIYIYSSKPTGFPSVFVLDAFCTACSVIAYLEKARALADVRTSA
jgi:hypothetical protein